MRACPTQQGTGCVRLPAAAQKQDEAHDVFVLLRLVGVDRDRGNLPGVVKNRIARGGPALVLGPAAAQATLDVVKRRCKGAFGGAGGFEREGVAGIGSRSVERTVSPAGQRKRCFQEIALTRLPDDGGKPLFGVYERGDAGECRTGPVVSACGWYLRHQHAADT